MRVVLNYVAIVLGANAVVGVILLAFMCDVMGAVYMVLTQ